MNYEKMNYKKDFRDIDVTDPELYLAYTSPNTSPKTILYVLKSDIEGIKERKLPQRGDFGTGMQIAYFSNTNGRFAGIACTELFLRAPEIQAYLLADKEFIVKAIEQNVTWFLPQEIIDVFIF